MLFADSQVRCTAACSEENLGAGYETMDRALRRLFHSLFHILFQSIVWRVPLYCIIAYVGIRVEYYIFVSGSQELIRPVKKWLQDF